MGAKAKYEEDFFLWSQEQAAALREAAVARTNLPIDFEQIAEEIDDLGRSSKTAIRNLCKQVIVHRLKLDHSPALYPRNSWAHEITNFQTDIALIVSDSPSLRQFLPRLIDQAWLLGRRYAIADLFKDGVDGRDLPELCPYSARDILGEMLDDL